MLWLQILSLLLLLSCGLGYANSLQNTVRYEDVFHVDKNKTFMVKRELPRSQNMQIHLEVDVDGSIYLKVNMSCCDCSVTTPPPNPTTGPTGIPTSPTTNPTTTPTPYSKEVIRANGPITSSGVAFNGKLYVGSYDSKVYEYDPATGQQKIVVQAKAAFFYSGAFFNNKLYFADISGRVYEYDPATGEQIEKCIIPGYISYSNLILNGKLYLITRAHGVFELDLVTGNHKRIISEEEIDESSDGVVLNGKIYFSGGEANESKVFHYDPVTSQKRVVVSDQGFYRGIALNGKIYFPTIGEKIYEYDPMTEKTKIAYTFAAEPGIMGGISGMAFHGKLYFRTNNGLIQCDPTTGREQIVLSPSPSSNGVALNGKLYFGALAKVYEYDPVTEKQKVVIKTKLLAYFLSSGVVLNGKLYIGSFDYNVYEYDPAN